MPRKPTRLSLIKKALKKLQQHMYACRLTSGTRACKKCSAADVCSQYSVETTLKEAIKLDD